jgi:RNA polymerase sigma factor (sigma-70 family)
MRPGHASFLRQFLRLTAAPAGDSPADGDLLDRFTRARDESAFHELLRRHAPLVLGVCRRVVGDEQDAEDAFQATFLVLVRKASSIRRRASLTSWLHGVAYRCAARVRAANLRRRRHEGRLAPAPPEAPPDVSWQEVRQAIDEELARLPEKYRAPLVLCYLRGKTQCEAARELGWAPGVLRGRLDRGRERLRARLARRGLALSAGLLATALTGEAAVTPAALLGLTLRAALLVAAGRPLAAAAPGSVADLAKGAMRAMLWTKIQVVTACAVLVVGALGVGGVLGRQAARPAGDPMADPPQVLADPPRPAEEPPRRGKQPPREEEEDKPPRAKKPVRVEEEEEKSKPGKAVPRVDEEEGKAKPAPAKPTKPAEKQYAFSMDNKPWGEVFQWLSDQTGLAYVSTLRPTGTFTFIPPNNPKDKQFTITEIIDLVNEALQAGPAQHKFILLRRERSLLLLPADEKIDPTLVPRVEVSDLAKRGKRDLVKVVVSLNVLAAKDLAPDVKKMLGPFGEVIALDKANQLLVQDTAGNLSDVLQMVQEAEIREAMKQRENKGR